MALQPTDRFGNPIPEWYQGYVKAMGDRPFQTILSENLISTPAFLNSLPAEKADYAYAPGKWTIKEVMLHVVDCERIFSYRTLRFARNDKTALSGFDENEYTPNCGAASRSLRSIIEEYAAVRKSTIELFKNFDDEMLARTGTANNFVFSVDLCGIIIAGHELHHLKVIRERYL